jgi:hypothetical protein
MTNAKHPDTEPTAADHVQEKASERRRFMARGAALGVGGALAGLSAAGPAAVQPSATSSSASSRAAVPR